MASYNLRSQGSVEVDGETESSVEEDEYETESESDAIEDDPFYEPYLQNEMLMNVARIVRYECGRSWLNDYNGFIVEDDESSEGPVENTRVVPESEVELPPPPPPVAASMPVEAPPMAVEEQADPNLLGPSDFEGLPRYRLAFMCVRYFEFTGIRNIAVASSISNELLMRALCKIPRGRVVPDCSICSYPLWDSLTTKCCGQSLCIHCVNRCVECPYCRAIEY
jgi:hypothetical protein